MIDPEDTGDREERAECEKMHRLIKEYKMQVWSGRGRSVKRGGCVLGGLGGVGLVKGSARALCLRLNIK